jgi:hypothetical protein
MLQICCTSSLSPHPKMKVALLLAFGCLTLAPSDECGRCLLTKLGLAQFTARLGFWRLGYERHLAFNIFDALPPHAAAARYTRPIHMRHNAHPPQHQQSRRERKRPAALP